MLCSWHEVANVGSGCFSSIPVVRLCEGRVKCIAVRKNLHKSPLGGCKLSGNSRHGAEVTYGFIVVRLMRVASS